MNDEKTFCSEHGEKSGTICRTVKDIKTLNETVVQNRRDLEQRVAGSDMAQSEATARTFKKIDAVDSKKMDSKTFILIISIFGGAVLSSVGFNWVIQNSNSNKMTALVQEHSKENQAVTKELMITVNGMALDVGGIKKDITNLNKNFDDYKKWNETEHKMFRQSMTPKVWGPNGMPK